MLLLFNFKGNPLTFVSLLTKLRLLAKR